MESRNLANEIIENLDKIVDDLIETLIYIKTDSEDGSKEFASCFLVKRRMISLMESVLKVHSNLVKLKYIKIKSNYIENQKSGSEYTQKAIKKFENFFEELRNDLEQYNK